jgi:sulfatase maturation enzyme AslB (radical SAM superfamily)
MPWKTLRAALDLILDSKPRKVEIVFTGGEPLLEFPSIRRAVRYVEQTRAPGKTVMYSISTNGTLLTDEVIAFLEEHRVRTQLSFDGAAAQAFRGAGTFLPLDRTLDRLRKGYPDFYESSLRIALTTSPLSVAHLADSIAYFLRKKIEAISIMPSFASDAAWAIDRIDELDSQFERILSISLVHSRRTGKMPVEILRNVDDRHLRGPERRPMCGISGGSTIVVDADGEVYGCNLLVGSYQEFGSPWMSDRLNKLRMGPVDHAALGRRLASFHAAVRQERIFNRKDKKYSAYGACRDCRWLDRCFMCPACIIRVPGSSDPDRVSDFYCAFNQVAFKYRSRAPIESAPPARFAPPPRLVDALLRHRGAAAAHR